MIPIQSSCAILFCDGENGSGKSACRRKGRNHTAEGESLFCFWDLTLHRAWGEDGTWCVMVSAVDVSDAILLAETDGLTGLANRRRLASSLQNMDRGDALVLIDLDHFKQVNDTLGHADGDELLREFADTLLEVARLRDLVVRYGGEEFCMILPGAGRSGAAALLLRLKEHWRSEHPATTFSAGIALHIPGHDPEETVARADAALYRAKEAGRDRTFFASRHSDMVSSSVVHPQQRSRHWRDFADGHLR